jgi:three-Cys-motif partner protein
VAVPTGTRWPLDPHTKRKHFLLRTYLAAWVPILTSRPGRIVLIDGFAGPGRYDQDEEGSPLIALRALVRLHPPRQNLEASLVFIEADPERFTALDAEIAAFRENPGVPDWLHVEAREGEFAEVMTDAELRRLRGGRPVPTFAFIDPFGFSGVPLDVVVRIVGAPHAECLITFMFEAINRHLANPNPKNQAHFDELFGTREWRGFLAEHDPDRRRDGLVGLYRRQLMERARLKYVRTFEMIDAGNRTEYFLVFGTNSKLGLSKMKQAMWKADPATGSVFSDRTDPLQTVLMLPTATGLKTLLQARFREKGWVPIEIVSDFVLEDTPFSEAIHLKQKTLNPMEREQPPTLEVKREAGRRNRPGWYASGTKLRFL